MEEKQTQGDVSRLFVFAVMWSVGALLELEDRSKMEAFLEAHPATLDLPQTQGDQTIFEFMVNERGQWEHWSKKVWLVLLLLIDQSITPLILTLSLHDDVTSRCQSTSIPQTLSRTTHLSWCPTWTT